MALLRSIRVAGACQITTMVVADGPKFETHDFDCGRVFGEPADTFGRSNGPFLGGELDRQSWIGGHGDLGRGHFPSPSVAEPPNFGSSFAPISDAAMLYR